MPGGGAARRRRGPQALPALLIALALLLAALHPTSSRAAGSFSDWAAIIVAGDWRAHDGSPSQVFDNARRDLASALVARGFSADHVLQFSVMPGRNRGDQPLKSDPDTIFNQLSALSKATPGGCLIYFTSHGGPQGVLVGDDVWPPQALADLADQTCGERPTVVVVSACFSGVFIPAVSGPDRMVLTAARPDRSSFGCGQSDRYTYFDGCMLRELPKAHDFLALGQAAQACVAEHERELGASPPSEPQIAVGEMLKPLLPLYVFAGAP